MDRTSPVEIDGGPWAQVTTGGGQTLGLGRDGTLWSWGSNSSGTLGDATADRRPLPAKIGSSTDWALVAAAGNCSAALRRDGSLWVWGWTDSIGIGLEPRPLK